MVSPVETTNISTSTTTTSPVSKKIRKYTKKLEAIAKTKQRDPSTLNDEQKCLLASERDVRLLLDELIVISKEEAATSQASVSTEEPTPRDAGNKEKNSQLYSLAYILSFALDEDFKERLVSRGVTKEQIQALSNLEHQTAHITLADFSSRTDDLLNLDDMVTQLEKNDVKVTPGTADTGGIPVTPEPNPTPSPKGKGKGKGGKGKGKGKGGKGRKEDAKH